MKKILRKKSICSICKGTNWKTTIAMLLLFMTLGTFKGQAQVQTLCSPATVSNLVNTGPTGSTANWFTNASGGTALATSTALATGTYYVEQSIPLSIATLGSGFRGPTGIAVQADGKIIVADFQNNLVKRMNADGTGIVTLGSGFFQPISVTVEAGGTILIAEFGPSVIKRMSADGTVITTVASGFNNPGGVTVQSDGKILVANSGAGTIIRMDADGANKVTLGSGFNFPYATAVQSDGKIIFADAANSLIKRMDANGGNVVTLGNGFNNPRRIAIQADGKILIADFGNNAIKRMNADGTGIVTIGSGFGNTFGVAFESAGKILVADFSNNAIKRITEANTTARSAVNVTINTTAAPTATTPQVFAGGATIESLTATGVGLQWYENLTGGTVLPTTTSLVGGTTYYVSQSGTCGESTRTAVTVSKISEGTQTLCTPATVANLISTPSAGAIANWFTAATGGTALDTTTTVNSGTYYVAQSTSFGITSYGSNFSGPTGIAVQADGKVLVADNGNNAIKSMNADGTGIVTLGSGFNPFGIAIQADGKILVADLGSGSVKRMNADGTGIVTVGPAFTNPINVAVQADGKIIVATLSDSTLKRMNADGSGVESLGNGFALPWGIAIQADGKILVGDYGNSALKQMNADGTGIVTLGSGFGGISNIFVEADGKILVVDRGNNAVKRMNADGTGIVTLASGLNAPFGVAVQTNGRILFSDQGNNDIKQITEPSTTNRVPVAVTVLLTEPIAAPTAKSLQIYAGTATIANLTATGNNLQWYDNETGGTVLPPTTTLIDGTTYYVSQSNSCTESTRTAVLVRKISEASQSFCEGVTVNDLVTTPSTGSTIQWYSDAAGTMPIFGPSTLTNGTYYLSQQGPSTVSTFAGSGTQGNANGTGITAQFNTPRGVVTDSQGNVFVSDTFNSKIRKITPSGIVTDFVNLPSLISSPWGISIDNYDNLYIASSGNNKIIKVTASAVGTSYAGDGGQGFTNGPASSAQFSNLGGLKFDNSANVYIADAGNHSIRKISATGDVTTLAGSSNGFTNAQGIAAQFSFPYDVTTDSFGNVYVADINNHVIRKITPAGDVSTFAGSTSGYADGIGNAAQFNSPRGLAVDSSNNIYVMDAINRRVRKITPTGVVTTVAGAGTTGSTDGNGNIAQFGIAWGLTVDANGIIYIADSNNNKIRKITQAAAPSNIVAVTVNITPVTENITTITACDSYIWVTNDGQTYNESGTYTGATTGCVTEKLVLTITPSTTNTTTVTSCDTYTWAENGTTYTESGNYTVVNGCNTEILALTITPRTTNTTTVASCDSYTWAENGTTYTESGNYQVVNGCNTEILALTITPSTTNTTTIAACSSYYWSVNDQAYTTSGTYTFVNGCVTEILNVTITPAPDNSVTQSGDNLTASETNATYQWGICGIKDDFTPIASATSQSYLVTTSGKYAVEITKNGCTSISDCFNVTTLSNTEFDKNEFQYFPNPVVETLNMRYNKNISNVQIFDLTGRIVKSVQPNTTIVEISLTELASAMYIVKLQSEDNKQMEIKIVKK